MLSLILDTYLKTFSPLVRALSTMVTWKSAETLTTHGFSSDHVLASLWCCCCHGNCAAGTQSISSFSNAVNPQLNADAFCEKVIYNGPILMKLHQPVLGVRLFETQHRTFCQTATVHYTLYMLLQCTLCAFLLKNVN